jgi:hypothetical protein
VIQTRGSLYILTALILGIGLGLIYSWLIHPVAIGNGSPGSLRATDKDQYRVVTALAFVSNGDLVRAKARLDLLRDPDPTWSVQDQADRLSVLGETNEVTALRLLARALMQNHSSEQPEITQSP